MPKKITTLEELRAAANLKIAVICPNSDAWKRPNPAAFVLRLQGSVIVDLFERGLYVFEKPTPPPLRVFREGDIPKKADRAS